MAESRTASRPAFSVVIPALNRCEEFTLPCLDSLAAAKAATDSEVEVILVDDGSTDGTAETVAQHHPTVKILRNPEPTGFTRAANRGLGEAQGDLLLLLNTDTVVPTSLWATLSAAFQGQPRLGIAGAALRYPDGRPQWSGGWEPTPFWLFGTASGLPALLGRMPGARSLRPVSGSEGGPVDWVTGAAMAIRRSVWNNVGPLDERYYLYAQDLDLCGAARRADQGWEVRVLPDLPVIHHHGGTICPMAGKEVNARREDPQHLWTDLLRWADKWGGPQAARNAARAIRLGARMRLIGYRLWGLWRRIVSAGSHPPAASPYRLALARMQKELSRLTAGPDTASASTLEGR